MNLSDLAKKMIVSILIVAALCFVGSVIYYRSLDLLPFAIGLLLGSLVSIIKVILLEHVVNKAISLGKERAGLYFSLNHLLRLALSGAVLVIGAVVPGISLWGVAAGVLAFQIATYTMNFSTKKSKKICSGGDR